MNPPGQRYNGPRSHQMELNPTKNASSLRPSRILNGLKGVGMGGPSPSFPYSHNTIPGLGLDFSSRAPGPQKDQKPGIWAGVSQPFQATGQEPSLRPPQTGDMDIPIIAEGGDDMAVDVSEEGEISEGEIHDTTLYPEGQDNPTAASNTRTQPAKSTGIPGGQASLMTEEYAPTEATNLGMEWIPGHHAPTRMARERSGSYSPYLSPREINTGSLAQSIPAPEIMHENDYPLKNPELTVPSTEPSYPPSAIAASSPFNSLQSAKEQAQDAIKRLIPLNIKYRNFLEEGIDDAVLGPLFDDLGIGVYKDARESQIDDTNLSEAFASPKSPDISAPKAGSLSSKPVVAESPKTIGRSEERKDRIARLLAAKGSKSTAVTSTLAQTPENSPSSALIPPAQPCVKVQTEKSKLLQHKMEALRKSREKLAQARGEQPTKDTVVASSEPAENPVSDGVATAVKATEGMSDVADPSIEATLSGKPSPSIPGLFLSSTPQPPLVSRSCETHRTPLGTVNSTKRPFDQKVETGPFLIKVSDDEGDAEMDVDMPSQPLPTDQGETSSEKAAISKESGPAIDKPSRFVMNQMPAVTPSRSSSHNSGTEDLASMNRKIEAMKRKIAEAEARKRTKLSRQMSPMGSQPNESSQDGSIEAGSLPRDSTATSPPLERSRTPSNDYHSLQSAALTIPRTRAGLTRQPGSGEAAIRHSRSRAASERLPFIEARRREQLEKLKSLQSQIAKIEQEIARGMQEEEILKQDLEDVDSDEAASRSAVLPGERLPSSELPKDVATASHGRHDSEQSTPIASVTYYGLEVSAHSNVLEGSEPSPAIGSTTTGKNGSSPDKREKIQGSIGTNGEPNADERTNAGQSARMSPEPGVVDEAARIDAQSEPGHDDQGPERDAVMKDSEPTSSRALDDITCDYEPPAADLSASQDMSPSPEMRDSGEQEGFTVPSDSEKDGLAALEIGPQHTPKSPRETGVSTVDDMISLTKSVPENTTTSSALRQSPSAATDPGRSHFVPYETPLQYFRAYRFHPEFGQTVAGGLRSLTYSNKIDIRKAVCPDELNGLACQRGKECQFQHFDHMKAADDQILLQLGAANNYREEQRQNYISGLRQLLTGFRNDKVKDFNTISQGIIDYRAKFLGDRSKILPLGSVTI